MSHNEKVSVEKLYQESFEVHGIGKAMTGGESDTTVLIEYSGISKGLPGDNSKYSDTSSTTSDIPSILGFVPRAPGLAAGCKADASSILELLKFTFLGLRRSRLSLYLSCTISVFVFSSVFRIPISVVYSCSSSVLTGTYL